MTLTAKPPIVAIRNLTKRFGDRVAVKDLDLCIYPGECLGLLGPNGAGKTTTIYMLLGLVRSTSGEISIFGESIPERLKHVKLRIGVVPQGDNLDPDLTVFENLLVYAAYFGIDRSIARTRADDLLGFFALKNRSDEIIQHLSGGQRRRLLLSRALINAPELLILDEPTIGLDPQARHLIWERLEDLRSQGTTMLLTSHYMEEVSRLTNRVLILDEGEIVAQGDPGEMVADMIGSEVFEVGDSSEKLDALEETLRSCKVDIERVADRFFIYAHEPCTELDTMAITLRHVSKRPANLEDLFLKLTGRTLREN
ncbi:MAG: ATP-binding cassette domain-containing protein [Thermodesulfobacteriota bacterium]|nr:ATP-binding cassette domain-containing protein [Thermodesulfobacteriota bacterium]